MASETKILKAIFGPSIPTEKAAVLPAIMAHIRAIDDLLQGKTMRQAHKRISDPAISGPINRRIEELYAEIRRDRPDIAGQIWPKIAAAISQEFGVTISPDACRGRYKDAMERKTAAIMQQVGYAALSGEAIQPAPVVPLNAMDARILEMAEQDAMMHEICIAINRNFNRNFSTAEMAEKIRKLQGGANGSR